ncbi:uncharacterized protein EAF01_011552 [Botrytis porri]|uniref:uncharacterized protein n=1 Tax=Botrytis porri TaxID=87229 RepID=UPI0018FF88C0|nr:uncharacterized protein EAF01_011552 [Botrytis porri]KAF7884129.1 hypothetical protein EAF01_011552 [Botrytis porri]
MERGVRFAIRGGGHSLNAGAANIESEVTINLRALNKVAVNRKQTLVSIGGGARWGEVYSVVDATSGGRVADVGVGGLTTGGGISFFSAREGLVCDNVKNYEVVLADGSIVNANCSENRNLWQALKDRSNNFGVVTRFDIRTFPQENFFGGCIVHDISILDSQLKGSADFLENSDPYAATMMSISRNQKRNGYSIFSNLEYTKNEPSPKTLKPFLDAKPQYLNIMRISNLADFATEAGKYAASGLWISSNRPFNLEIEHSFHLLHHWCEMGHDNPTSSDYCSGSMRGSHLSWPLIFIRSSYFISPFLQLKNIEDDEKITMAARKLISDIDEAASEKGVGSDFKYLNYAAR